MNISHRISRLAQASARENQHQNTDQKLDWQHTGSSDQEFDGSK
jgi:hypothetical protein